MAEAAVKSKGKKLRRAANAALVVILAVLAAAGLWLLKTADPAQTRFFPPCLFHSVTGLWCAGCGSARALHGLLNGHVWAALRMNPLAVLALPSLLFMLALVFFRLWRKKPLPKMPSWVPWALIAVIVLYTVARNLSWAPFSWLAPTGVG
jgi:hypothetical protein